MPSAGPPDRTDGEGQPAVIGKIGVGKRKPEPPPSRPPKRRYRRLSGLACSAFFLAGVLGGTSIGLLFLGRRASKEEGARDQQRPIASTETPPADERGTAAPEVVVSTTKARPDRTPELLEASAKEVYCFFDIPDESPSAQVTARWLRGQAPPADAESTVVREESDHLRGYLTLRPPEGAPAFAEGIYEVQVLVDRTPVTDASFVMVKGAAGLARIPKGTERYRPAVTDLIVSRGPSRARPKKPFVLPANPERVQASFRYSHAVPGTAFIVYWLYEDGLIAQATTEVNIRQESGKAEAWLSPKPGQTLPNGRYGVEISIGEGTPPLTRADFWIGRRPRPDELERRR
jgi:hypothetical protein